VARILAELEITIVSLGPLLTQKSTLNSALVLSAVRQGWAGATWSCSRCPSTSSVAARPQRPQGAMTIGGLIAALLGVGTEGNPLEDIARPLSVSAKACRGDLPDWRTAAPDQRLDRTGPIGGMMAIGHSVIR
jgi:hypothetical protein